MSVSRSAALSGSKRATTDAMTTSEARAAPTRLELAIFAAMPLVSYGPLQAPRLPALAAGYCGRAVVPHPEWILCPAPGLSSRSVIYVCAVQM